MESLMVLDLRYQKLCELIDDSGLGARGVVENFSMNEIVGLSFRLPIANPKKSYIINENIIEFKDEYYIIKGVNISHSEDGSKMLEINCRHSSITLQSNVVVMSEQTPLGPVSLMKKALVYNGDTPTLGWSVGEVTVDLNRYRGLEKSEQSSFSILLAIAEKYDGRLEFISKTRKVNLKPIENSVNTSFELSVNKNLKGINIEYNTDEIVTRLYCFGASDKNGNEINVSTVNPTKLSYIDNFQYFTGLGYTQTDFNKSPELFIKTNIWRDSNYHSVTDLYIDGLKELDRISIPKINVNVTALDLTKFENYGKIELKIGDAINIRDEDLGLTFLCHVISRSIDYEQKHILNIEVTNKLNYRNVISDLFNNVNTMSQVVTGGAQIKGSSIDGISSSQVRDIDAKYASIEHLNANYIDATNLAATYATFLELEAEYAKIENLEANYLTIKNADVKYLTASNADIKYATITELETQYITAENANIKYATIVNLNAINAKINNLETSNITVDYLNANFSKIKDADIKYALISSLDAIQADIDELSAREIDVDQLDARYATITKLESEYSTINYLDSTYLKAAAANINYAKIKSLDAVVANIDLLGTSVATIKTLVNGNLTSNNIQSLNLTTLNTTIANGMIKNAMIDSLSADKINAGSVSTNKVKIKSDNGGLIISDNTIQINDGTKARVQIGKDAGGDYNIYIWDLQGNLMFDATGITDKAIKKAIIRNDMVSTTANIDASKLNINTLFKVINEDGTNTLNGSKIKLDAGNQTLDIVFNSMTTKVTEIENKSNYRLEVVSNNGTTIKNGIGTIVLSAIVYNWNENITDTLAASSFEWIRTSRDTSGDIQWNSTNGKGKKQITLTHADIDKYSAYNFRLNI